VNILDEFQRHWAAIPKSGLMPSLSDYLDRLNPRIQPWTIIVDINEDAMPVRLCGTGIAELLGNDFTGRDYLSALNPASRGNVLARDRACATHPCGLRLDLTASTITGRLFLDSVLALPVRRAHDAVCLVRVSSIEQTTDWRELPMSVLTYRSSQWIDIGAGIPAAPPWADTNYRN
jgi:hypothetical protein